MKIKILFSILFFATTTIVKAQSISNPDSLIAAEKAQIKKNAVHLQIMGPSLLYSLSYERLLFSKHVNNLSASIGAEYIQFVIDIVLLTPQIIYSVGKRNHYFYTGMGLNFIFENYNSFAYEYSLTMGYRYQRKKGGFMFILGGSYLFVGDTYRLQPNVGVGYTF